MCRTVHFRCAGLRIRPQATNVDSNTLYPGIQSTTNFAHLDQDGHFCYTQEEILIWQECMKEAKPSAEAKRQMMDLMQAGLSWREAASQAGVPTSRSTAYRWFQAYRVHGEAALRDGRHGHPAKVREPVLQWLENRCRDDPHLTSSRLQEACQDHLGVTISITHLNHIRATHGLKRQVARMGKKSRAGRIP
jgi:transposase